MARYLLAVPAAFLAAMALRSQAIWVKAEGQKNLNFYISIASIGFFIYGISQVFVPPMEMLPARLVNASSFREWFGFPIQIIRTLAAITVTIGILRATQVVEKQRQHQLLEMQKARLETLERLHNETEKRETMRRELLRHVVQAQEDERARIARELHDETSQTLAAFALDLATLQTKAGEKSEDGQIIDRLQDLAKQMSKGLYRLVHDLRPAQLDGLGLVPTLQYLIDQFTNSNDLKIKLDVQGQARRLDPILETVLFRVTQEALNNVIRHSKTNQATISLSFQRQEVILSVSDSGVGFDPGQTFSPPRGWGLTGMRERVEAVGGQLDIHSEPGKGTKVEVSVDVFDIIP